MSTCWWRAAARPASRPRSRRPARGCRWPCSSATGSAVAAPWRACRERCAGCTRRAPIRPRRPSKSYSALPTNSCGCSLPAADSRRRCATARPGPACTIPLMWREAADHLLREAGVQRLLPQHRHARAAGRRSSRRHRCVHEAGRASRARESHHRCERRCRRGRDGGLAVLRRRRRQGAEPDDDLSPGRRRHQAIPRRLRLGHDHARAGIGASAAA